MRPRRRLSALCVAALCTSLVVACGVREPRPAPPEYDPIEGVNRRIFWFNDKVDVYALEPVAKGWDKITPDAVKRSVSHFFSNLRFPITASNDLLQGKVKDAGVDVARFGVNTTVGVLGFFDPASHWGLEEHIEDFGQTLGVWGVPPGPYLVLPLLGPSTARDTGGLAVDYGLSVLPFFVDQLYLLGPRVLDTVNARALVLDEVRRAKEASFDYYSFVRNAYYQRRNALLNDSAEAPSGETEDLYNIQPAR